MTGRDAIQWIKDWWNNHPTWHERIILTAIGIAIGFFLPKVL